MNCQLDHLLFWMQQRQMALESKTQGKPRPWCSSPIIEKYRFCNVHREDDRVTRWLRTHWQSSQTDGVVPVWWWFMVARMVNWPPTLAPLRIWARRGHVHQMVGVLQSYMDERPKKKVFGSAYIVSTNGRAMDKADYFGLLWKEALATPIVVVEDSLAATHANLTALNGLGSFMAAQIVADMKHDGPLMNAHDYQTWAAPGPGSQRGLARLEELPIRTKFGNDFLRRMNIWRDCVNKELDGYIYVDAQDFQNCLCEFDKFMRALNGEGTPKSQYESHAEFYDV